MKWQPGLLRAAVMESRAERRGWGGVRKRWAVVVLVAAACVPVVMSGRLIEEVPDELMAEVCE